MAKRRTAIGKKTRFEVFKRDGFRCQYCGACPPGVLLHVDHIMAVANGGTNDPDNLITSCEPCNLGKGAQCLDSIPESLQSKAARIMEAEEQLLGYQTVLRARAERLEGEVWEVAEVMWPGSSTKGANRKDLQSIKQFIERVGVMKVLEMVEVAKAAKPYGGTAQWRYFCGCCWRVIRRQEEGVLQ